MDRVRVRYRKYDGALHWHFDSVRLGTDRFGTWLGAPPGTELRRGSELSLIWDEAQVLLVPEGKWWTANFNDQPNKTEVYCDITTVPTWHGDELRAVDLDLDVQRRRDGRVERLDEDEFAEHRVKYGYPPDVIAAAEAAAAELFAAISANEEPFATVYKGWLAMVSGAATPSGSDPASGPG
jgi:protein associated with RNAse G/E